MYRLDNSFARSRFAVTVVGCGGTGGFVAEGLCRLLPPRADLVLVDPDRVEERNLGRQNFTREDMGRFKSEALAHRLARRYGRAVGYTVLPVVMAKLRSGLVIGCVDNGLARRDIAARIPHRSFMYSAASPMPTVTAPSWWLDAGNAENYGQILIGNGSELELSGSFDEEQGICFALPLPTIQRPELLAEAPRRRDCAEIAVEQGPTINQAMAALVLEVARRVIEGTCPWMQLYCDLEAGTLTPALATPEAVSRITGIRERRLLERR